jgi:hypothetical protein
LVLRRFPRLVLVVVALMGSMTVALVGVIHVVAVIDGLMPAAVIVHVGVALVSGVGQGMLVVVALMGGVRMPVMDVVHVSLMTGAGVPAARPVGVGVLVMGAVPGTGHCSSVL